MTLEGRNDGLPEPRLEKARHVKYWTRCIKTFLPHQYTGNDSNRMYLAFLMVSALDLLDALYTACSEDERCGFIDWIYHCQHPDGGFRMWPGTDFGERANASNAKWDPANVPATYFALSSLLILGDDFKRVRRKQTLQWLRRVQRPDGSFGEILMDGRVEGGRDPRAGYCAAGVRHFLRGANEDASHKYDGIEDINIDDLVRCIRICQVFDGGIADEPFHEPHAGYTFCSLGCLSLMDRLNTGKHPSTDESHGPSDVQEVIRWLVHRQTNLLDPDAALDSEFVGAKTAKLDPLEVDKLLMQASDAQAVSKPSSSSVFAINTECAGMNGRTNKVADTCYAWWSGASLHMLGQPNLYDQTAVRKYLLEKTQHPVLGGFGKFPGDLPDLYHSYLGLAALSLAGSDEVKEVDASMCVSKDVRARLPELWEAWDVENRADDAST
ncbi:geranylgeranyl transferase type-1 subunit beta [Vermiconidia calcicola]|uniref:Geranylgeranyl transferase type-1 subunit beta n=1 Tax=Vermiconidia calcicola TaxID=1690605 RepID=A0ACC3MQR5_9PEZI|nr:geranylgeranyl transferase type-1 subunit beta [Vermiconidia calcicola]